MCSLTSLCCPKLVKVVTLGGVRSLANKPPLMSRQNEHIPVSACVSGTAW